MMKELINGPLIKDYKSILDLKTRTCVIWIRTKEFVISVKKAFLIDFEHAWLLPIWDIERILFQIPMKYR